MNGALYSNKPRRVYLGVLLVLAGATLLYQVLVSYWVIFHQRGLLAQDFPLRGVDDWLILPFVCLGVALFIGLIRPADPNAFTASLLFLSFSGTSSFGAYAAFPPVLRELGLVLNVTQFSCWSYLFMRFFLRFPSPSILEERYPRLKWYLLVFPIVFTLWNIYWSLVEGVSCAGFDCLPPTAGWLDFVLGLSFIMLFALGFLSLVLNVLRAKRPDDRRRAVILLFGAVGLLPALASYFYRAILHRTDLPDWFYLSTGISLGLFPLSFAYAIVKHRVFDIRLIIRRGLQYAMLSRFSLLIEGAVVFLALFLASGPLFERINRGKSGGLVGLALAITTMGVVVMIKKVNQQVMGFVDRRFFREAYDGRRILSNLAHLLQRLAGNPHELVRTVAEQIAESLHPTQIGFFIMGADVSKFPLPGSNLAQLRTTAASNPGDYVCFFHHTGEGAPLANVAHDCRCFTLSAESLMVKKLSAPVKVDLLGLEVYLDDPDSWIAPLLSAGDGASNESGELGLLRDFNLRLVLPLATSQRLIGLMCLGEKRSAEPYDREDRELLAAVAQQMALALDYAQFIREEAEEINFRHEGEIAKKVQEKLFPQKFPAIAGMDYTGACVPASWVGGDYFDFLELSQGRLGIALGDVSGKGVSAALLMASLQAMLRIHAEIHETELDRLVGEINRRLCLITDQNRFASFFYGVFDPATRVLSYVNAGHNPPMVFRPRPAVGSGMAGERQATNPELFDIIRLNPTGLVLGVMEDAQYEQAALPLQGGDVLLIFSDGVTDALNPNEVEFGEERVKDAISRCTHAQACEIYMCLLKAVRNFTGETNPGDDLTMIVAKVN